MNRCHKCGYSNQQRETVCIKCRTSLETEIEEEALGEHYGLPGKKTIVISSHEEKPWDQPNPVQLHGNFRDVAASEREKRSFLNLEKLEEEKPEEKPEVDNLLEQNQIEENLIEENTLEEQAILREFEMPLQEETSFSNTGAPTVRRVVPEKRSVSLVAISLEEEKELRRIAIEGESVSLDRAKLDATNNSISRSGHARLYMKDGGWYIENTTPLKATFVQVNEPVKLSNGDVILIGDSLFRFKQV